MKTLILTQGKTALLDDKDFEKFKNFIWHSHSIKTSKNEILTYAYRTPNFCGQKIEPLLHRAILNLKKGDTCKFKDGNPLNCRRNNLIPTIRSNQ